MPPTSTATKPLSKRALAAKQAAQEMKIKKLHVIASRRAKAQGMDKESFIAEIVKGNFRPITAEDIAAEPDVIVEPAEAAAEAPAEVPTEAVTEAPTDAPQAAEVG